MTDLSPCPNLIFTVADGVARITLNRPERMNAFTFEMIDAWAEAQQTTRSAAIRLLVELGLNAAPRPARPAVQDHGALAIEELAARQIAALLDPSLSQDERERRVRRLIDGPPELSGTRIDLPKHES